MTYGWQCASWTCWVGVNTRFIFDIRSCFFFHTMFWRKKSVSAFFFGFTSRTMRVVFLTSLDLLLTFTGEYYWQSTEALGLLLFEDTIIFSDKQQFSHTFPYKMADFWTFRLLLNVLGHIKSWSKKKLVKTLGVFPTTTETNVILVLCTGKHWQL